MLSKKTYFFHILIPLMLGLILYIVLRPDTYISIFLRQILHVEDWAGHIDTGSGSSFFEFLRNFASDILWAYALVFAVHYFARNMKLPLYGVILLCVGFVVMIELFQYFDIIPGIFDMIDILLETTAVVVAAVMLCIMRKGEPKGYEK